MYGKTIEESIRQAASYFTQCREVQGSIASVVGVLSIPHDSLISDEEFIAILASNVSSLTLTSLVSYRILQHQDVFAQILGSITHINLNLLIRSARHQNVKEIIEIIQMSRRGNLRSISIKLGKESVLNQLEAFQELIGAIFFPLKNCSVDERCVDSLKRTYTSVSGSTTAVDDIYDNLTAKRSRVSEESSSDLYDFVFDSDTSSDIVIDTKISKLKLCASENPFYGTFFDYIAQWAGLQVLHIEGYYPSEDAKIKNAFSALESFNSLKELTLSEFWFPANHDPSYPSEESLIQLARPSCSVHEMKKSLKKLRLLTCCYSESFVSSLFAYAPSRCCLAAPHECVRDGLESLEITLFRSSDDSFGYLDDTCTLKELIIHKYTWNQVDAQLFDAIGHTQLSKFVLNSKLQPLVVSPQNVLELLSRVNLEHLELSHVCTSEHLFECIPDEGMMASLRTLNLAVFVWTRNGMKNSGLEILSDYLPYLRRLKVLDISGNLFDIEGVTVFLKAMHRWKYFLDKLSVGGPNVRSVDIEKSGLSWIVDTYTHFFLASYIEDDRSDHIAQM